jgi:cytochrome bd-type quinol oxidase subunit 2
MMGRSEDIIVLPTLVFVMAVGAIVRGLTMKSVELPSLPSGRPEDYKSYPAEWYHRMFYVLVGLAGAAGAAYYVGARLGWFR